MPTRTATTREGRHDPTGATAAAGTRCPPRLGTLPAWRTTFAASSAWSSSSTRRKGWRALGRRMTTSRPSSTRRTRPRRTAGNPHESARTTRLTATPRWRLRRRPRRRRSRATAPAASTRTPSPRRLTFASSTSGACTAWTTTPARSSPCWTTSPRRPRLATTRTPAASCAPPSPPTRRIGKTARTTTARKPTARMRTTPPRTPTARSPPMAPPTPPASPNGNGGPRRRLGRFTPTAGAWTA
mmetsp:Transcript_4357/g.19805  ORF Transcript_4357/g.19805 Transcript_4357/m.19805 type:complete len:242 (+) Transcript_4357:364-1089(+)